MIFIKDILCITCAKESKLSLLSSPCSGHLSLLHYILSIWTCLALSLLNLKMEKDTHYLLLMNSLDLPSSCFYTEKMMQLM